MVLKLCAVFCVCLVIVNSTLHHLREKRSPQNDWWYIPDKTSNTDYGRRGQFQNNQSPTPQHNPQLYTVSIVSVNLDNNKEIISHNVSNYQLDLKSGNAIPISPQNRQESQTSTLNNMNFMPLVRFSDNTPSQYIQIVDKSPNYRELTLQDKYLPHSPTDQLPYSLGSDKRYSSSYLDMEPSSYNEEPLLLNRPQEDDRRPPSPIPYEQKPSYNTRPPTSGERRLPSTPLYDQGSSQYDKRLRPSTQYDREPQYYSKTSLNRNQSYNLSKEPFHNQTNTNYRTTEEKDYDTPANRNPAEINGNNLTAIHQSAIEAIFGKNPKPNSQSQDLINNGRGVPLVNDKYINAYNKKQPTRPPSHRFQVVPITPES